MANYGHASGSAVIAAAVLTTVLATFAVFSRLFTRRIVVHNLGLDDFLAVAALALSIGLTILISMEVQHGLGQHDADLSSADMVAMKKSIWADMFVYYLGIATIKESILLQYLRIFPQRRFRVVCYTLMAIVFIHGNWSFWTAIFACQPVQLYWNLPGSGIEGHCLDAMAVGLANTGVNIFTDLAICILPLPVLASIDMPRKLKSALMVLFGLAGLVCMMSVLRLAFLYIASTATDAAYNTPMVSIWSSVGLNIAIICSCLPTLKACMARMFPTFMRLVTPRKSMLSDEETVSETEMTVARPEPAHINEKTHRSIHPKDSTDAFFHEDAGLPKPAIVSPHDSGCSVNGLSSKVERGSSGYEDVLARSGLSPSPSPHSSIGATAVSRQDLDAPQRKTLSAYSSQEWVKGVFNIDAA